MPVITRRTPCSRSSLRSLEDYVVDSRGAWTNEPDNCGGQLLRLRSPDDSVTLSGPLDLNVSVYAEHELRGASGDLVESRQPLMSHDVTVPAGTTWHYRMEPLRGLGGNAGCSAWIRPIGPRAEPPLIAAGDLPCDYAVRPISDLGSFFPSPCDPCEGGPIRVPPVDCGPAVDVLPARGGCVRPRFYNGMLITREDLETEQRYFRLKLRMLNRAMGTGVVWGLDVALRGEHVVVGPGYAVDCCGNDLTLGCDYAVPASSLLRDPAVCGSDRPCYALLLEYAECPEEPRPVHGDSCEPRRSGCELSRIRETVRLRLVPPISAPQPRLAQFLQRLDDLRGTDDAAPVKRRLLPGEAIVDAPADVAVPFRIGVTLGAMRTLQPSRTETVTDGIDPVLQTQGTVGIRVFATAGARLAGSVRSDDGNLAATLSSTGAVWSATYSRDSTDFAYVIDWSADTADGMLRGSTNLQLTFRPGARIEGRIDDGGNGIWYTRWPQGHGLQVGDQVTIETRSGDVTTSVLKLVDETMLTIAKPEPPSPPGELQDVVYRQEPSRLDIEIPPTEVTIEPVPRAPLCCGPGCCDDREPLRTADRLRALLAALLYGRLVQRSAMLGGDVPTSRLLFTLRGYLDVPRDGLAEFESAAADLYRAWCAASLYPGPAHCDPDGVVIGCAHVQGGAICSVDALEGRRFVVHQPLLDHWGFQFGLDPLDRRVGELFRRLCCLSHLPGFGELMNDGQPTDDLEESPAVASYVLGSVATQPFGAAAYGDPSPILGALAGIGELDLGAIAAVVDELICGRGRVGTEVVRDPGHVREFVATALGDLPSRDQPAQNVRETSRDVARRVLEAVPVDAVVGGSSPLSHVFDSIDVRTLHDALAVPSDTVADLAVPVASPEQVDTAMERTNTAARRVVTAVAAAMRTMRGQGLAHPRDLENQQVVEQLASEISTRLREDDIHVEPGALAEALRAPQT